MRTTISLEDGLLRRAKKAAAERGVSLARLVEDAVRAALDVKPGATKLTLPVSTARGGLLSGVDPSSNESLWAALERDD